MFLLLSLLVILIAYSFNNWTSVEASSLTFRQKWPYSGQGGGASTSAVASLFRPGGCRSVGGSRGPQTACCNRDCLDDAAVESLPFWQDGPDERQQVSTALFFLLFYRLVKCTKSQKIHDPLCSLLCSGKLVDNESTDTL